MAMRMSLFFNWPIRVPQLSVERRVGVEVSESLGDGDERLQTGAPRFRYEMNKRYGATMTRFKLLRSSPRCMNTSTIYAALTKVITMNVHLMAVQVKVSERLKMTPMPTSTAVMRVKSAVTNQIFLRMAAPASSLWCAAMA